MRAKFQVQMVEEYAGGQRTFNLNAVTGDGTPENQSFWNATPSGSMKIVITNPAARDFLKVGKAYYLDFTEAD